jgi:hypothetical protein
MMRLIEPAEVSVEAVSTRTTACPGTIIAVAGD